MAGFNVLKRSHVMIGLPFLEWHDYLPPPGITPAKAGHLCGGILACGVWGVISTIRKVNDEGPNKDVLTAGNHALSRTHDMGPLIPHYNLLPPAPPNLLLPVFLLASGSKAYMGASTVQFNKGSAAFAIAVKVNFNLNCAGATLPPLPSGLVIAMPQTVEVGVTMGDMIAGLANMVFDAALQFILNRLFSSKFMGSVFSRISGRVLPAVLQNFMKWPTSTLGMKLATVFGEKVGFWAAQAGGQVVKNAVGVAVGILVGSPIGYSPGWSPTGGSDWDKWITPGASEYQPGNQNSLQHDKRQKAIDDYYTNKGESPFI